MKNKIVEQQLKKVQLADLSNCQEKEDCYVYLINKHVEAVLEEDKCYLIKIDIRRLNSDDYAYLVNYNKVNVYPEHEYMKIDVIKKIATLSQVNGIYYDYENKKDLNKSWSGWLPQDVIKIIEVL